jgi:hypothetical protein
MFFILRIRSPYHARVWPILRHHHAHTRAPALSPFRRPRPLRRFDMLPEFRRRRNRRRSRGGVLRREVLQARAFRE